MYPKKTSDISKSQSTGKLGLPKDKEAKLLKIQEKEKLKGLIVHKFLDKYGKVKGLDPELINREVINFMKTEKITEESLRRFEQRILNLSKNDDKQSTKQNHELESVHKDNQSIKNEPIQYNDSKVNLGAQSIIGDEDAQSIASSRKPKSIYYLDDAEDEWATILKYDSELYKKERELEKLNALNKKALMKQELDKQIEEKKKAKQKEEENMKEYMKAVEGQLKTFDTKENKKIEDAKNKILQEKISRDKQMYEEYLRKKQEKKTEKQLDELLVKKIKEELEREAQAQAEKREQERLSLQALLKENEINKMKMLQEAKSFKELETKQQREALNLMEKQESERMTEIKAREARAKKVMSIMEQTIVKDQKQQFIDEEHKLLKHLRDKEAQEMQDDNRKKEASKTMKKEISNYLKKQMIDRELQKKEEEELNKKQAILWEKDTQEYNETEQKKKDTLCEINKKHAEILKQQIEEEKRRKKQKMSTEELLLNKDKLKQIADVEQGKFQKTHLQV